MSEHSKRKKARSMLTKAGYKSGGHMHADEAEDKALVKRMVKKPALKLKDGGCAEGGSVKPRADRLARGGKAHGKGGKGHTTVNVVVGHPQPKPVPVPVPVPGGAGGPPPGAMAGPGGPPPPDMPPPGGGGPMGLKRGGRAKRAMGGGMPPPTMMGNSQRDAIGGMPMGQFKKGGRAKEKFPVPMEFGGGGGKGRLEKIKDYG